MMARRCPARLVLALALVASAAGCKTVAKGDLFEDQIEQQLAAKGIHAEVTCPKRIPLGKVEDNHFDCDVVEDGGRHTPVVVTLDDKGAWRLVAKTAPPDLDPGE